MRNFNAANIDVHAQGLNTTFITQPPSVMCHEPPAGRIAPQTDGLEIFRNSCHTTLTAAIVTHFVLFCAPVGPQGHLVCLCMFVVIQAIPNNSRTALPRHSGFPPIDLYSLHFNSKHIHLYCMSICPLCVCIYVYIYIYLFIFIFTPKQTRGIPRQVIPEGCRRCSQCIPSYIDSLSIHAAMTNAWSAMTITSFRSGSCGGIPT